MNEWANQVGKAYFPKDKRCMIETLLAAGKNQGERFEPVRFAKILADILGMGAPDLSVNEIEHMSGSLNFPSEQLRYALVAAGIKVERHGL